MTIKKRLALSNVLMILVPVVITMLIAVGCVFMLVSMVSRGTGLSFDDNEDFYQAGSGLSATVVQALKAVPSHRISHLKKLSSMIDQQNMSLTVICNGRPFYQYGDTTESDAVLIKTVSRLGRTATATNNKRGVYACKRMIGDNYYKIYIFSKVSHLSYGTLINALIAAGIVLLMTIVLAILFTDRFLIKFVFKRIEEPLDVLGEGVRAVGQGNLDYRIPYERKDEFLPVCCAFNDMADRLQESTEEVRKHEESRKVLLADISHDLRSPLTSILAYVEGLMDGVAQTDEMRQKYLNTIREKALAIQHMVSQIFMFSKMDLDQYQPVLRQVDLGEELRAFVEKDAARYEDGGLKVSLNLPARPIKILGDSGLIQRIFTNIAENSLKYMEGDHGTLRVTLMEAKENRAQLILEDDGPGVPEGELEKIFTSFYRTDVARRDPDKGSGLGLAIVAKAVRTMKGDLRAENVLPHGLRIIVEIPEDAGEPEGSSAGKTSSDAAEIDSGHEEE